MRHNHGKRTGLVLASTASAIALVTGLIWAPGAGTAAPVVPTPTEVTVVPPPVSLIAPVETVVAVGDTGYLHRTDNGPEYLWTRFADKSTTVVSSLTGVGLTSDFIEPAGGDYFAWDNENPQGQPHTFTLLDAADQTSHVITLPTGSNGLLAASATTALTSVGTAGSMTFELITYAPDGSYTTAPVAGMPSGIKTASVAGDPYQATDGTSTIIQYYGATGPRDAIIDLHTGAVALIPGNGASRMALSDDFVVRSSTVSPAAVSVFSRPGLTTGTDTSSTTVALPALTGSAFFIAGRHLIVSASTLSTNTPTIDVPIDGGPPTTLYLRTPANMGGLRGGPHGTVVAVGGSSASDWAAHHLSGGTNGTLVDDASIKVTPTIADAGVSIDSGVLHHVIAVGSAAKPTFFSVDQPILHGPDDAQYTGMGGFRPEVNACQTGVSCLRVVPGSYYGPLYLMANNEISMQRVSGTVIPNYVWPWGPGAVIADSSYYYAIVNVPTANQQYVISVASNQVISTGTITGSAVWYTKLFQSSTTAGSVIETDLDNPATPKLTIPIGASCTPTELQADNDWLYWSCGPAGPAGAYDLVTGANVTLPAGVAQLGDGYVVMHDANSGVLKLYDFHSGAVAAPVTIGTVQTGFVTDDRLITWAVDKHSGDIAYVDADDSVHVIDPGVPHTAARSEVPFTHAYSFPRASPSYMAFFANRPLSSWTITITSATLGQVKTLTGGAVRDYFTTFWDGTNTAGTMMPSGYYTWTMSMTTADGTSSVGSGPLLAVCGAYVYRSYDCDGSSAILGVKSDGSGYWYNADKTPTGGLISSGATDSWPWGTYSSTFSAVIPWGDYNGDGFGDVLARTGTGTIKAYLGRSSSYFNPAGGTKTVTVATGWASYTKLLTTGDLTGDGLYDMLATDKAGSLYMMPGKAGGGLGARVKIGSGWQKFTRIVGVGDITGDHHPDLVAFDTTGNMILYAGTGHGTLSAGVKIGTGFAGYTAIIGPGDVNRDGHNDLVARDKNGVLWLFPGNGTKGFGARVQIGSGWNTYTHIF